MITNTIHKIGFVITSLIAVAVLVADIGALVLATVRRGRPGAGVTFHAGAGVGTVTRAGLPLAVGEPAINPAPRRIMTAAMAGLLAI